MTFTDDDEMDRKCDLEFKQTGIPKTDKHGNPDQPLALKMFWQNTIFKGLTVNYHLSPVHTSLCYLTLGISDFLYIANGQYRMQRAEVNEADETMKTIPIICDQFDFLLLAPSGAESDCSLGIFISSHLVSVVTKPPTLSNV